MKTLYLSFLMILSFSINTNAINAPSITSPSNGATNQDLIPYIDWTSITGNEGYVYQLDTVSDFSSTLLIQDTTGTDVSFKHLSNLFFGTTYYWRVMTLNSGGNSAWSNTWSFTTKSTVYITVPTNGSTNQNIELNIDWTDITGNNGYMYQVDTSSTFNSSLFVQGTTTNNSFVGLSDLLFGTTYYWRACAISVNDTSNWSNTWSFTTKSTVNNTSPTNGSTNQNIELYINWTDITGNNGYIYQVDTSSAFNSSLFVQGTTSTNNSFVGLSDLLFGTTYYWRACAKSVNDTSAWSSSWSFTTKSTVITTSPNNGAINQETSLYLDWSDITGNNGYMYQIDTSNSFNTSLLQEGATTQNNSYVGISDLLYGTTYYWRACAKSNIDTSDWSNISHFRTSYQLTNAPNLVSPSNGSIGIDYNTVDLEWSSISQATAYQYQYSIDNLFISNVFNGTSTYLTETINNLNQNTYYYWRVRGQNSSGFSPWSDVWQFTTESIVFSDPTLISPLNNSTEIDFNSVNLEWNSLWGVTEYIYEISTDNTFASGVTSETITDTIKTLIGLAEDTQYFWRVKASDGATESNWSIIWNFTTDNTSYISNFVTDNPIQIYPNPTTGFFTVRGIDLMSIEIINSNGQTIENRVIDNNFTVIDLTNVSDGLYFLIMINKKEIVYEKLVKQ